VDSKGDTTNIFLRKTRVGDLESWSDLNGAVYIAGSAPANSNTRVGYVTLGDIRFRNQVEVERGTVTDGSTSFTYRETFYWEEAIDVLITLRLQYPRESGFFLKDLLHKLYHGNGEVGEEMEIFLEERLPGINLALNTGIQIRLNMPGRVMDSNHHQMDGSTLVWEFEPLNAVASPIEIYAESVAGG
jgi:hypothetical protein